MSDVASETSDGAHPIVQSSTLKAPRPEKKDEDEESKSEEIPAPDFELNPEVMKSVRGESIEALLHRDPENLGSRYAESAWIIPTEESSKEHVKDEKFMGGKAPLSSSIEDMSAMGVGIDLYFRVLKYVAVLMFVCTSMVAPVLFLNKASAGMPAEQADSAGLVYWSLGNQGLDLQSLEPQKDCKPVNGTKYATYTNVDGLDCTGKTARLEWGPYDQVWNSNDIAYVVTVCDFFYSLIFAVFIVFLNWQIDKKVEETDANNITPSDYAVYVRDLPRTATEEQIRKFFSDRYNLQTRAPHSYPMICGCLGKPHKVKTRGNRIAPADPQFEKGPWPCTLALKGVEGEQNVGLLHTGQTSDMRYDNSWVAEVSVVHPYGSSIEYYMGNQKTLEKLREARARVKKFSPGTPLRKNYKKDTQYSEAQLEKKKAKAEKKLKKLEEKIAKVNKKFQKNIESVKLRASECECAYVVFNNEGSLKQCLHDYRTSYLSRLFIPCKYFQPAELRFKDSEGKLHPLTIRRAPEPANILWENLQITGWNAWLRRAFTTFCTLMLLAIAFVLIYYAQIEKANAAKSMPSAAECSVEVPAAHFGHYNFSSVTVKRNQTQEKAQCGDNEYFMYYEGAIANGDYVNGLRVKGYLDKFVSRGSVYSGVADLGLTATANDPTYTADHKITYLSGRDPNGVDGGNILICGNGCVSTSDTTQCSYLSCVDSVYDATTATNDRFNYNDHECKAKEGLKKKNSYDRKMIVACYCLDIVKASISDKGLIDGATWVVDNEPMCIDVAKSLILANAMTIIAALAVVFVNTVLRAFLTSITGFERHHSISDEISSTATKIFFTQFVNTALIILLVNQRVDGDWRKIMPQFLDDVVFNGDYTDTSRGWYTVVGAAISLTMLLNVFIPHLAPAVKYYIQIPIQQRLLAKSALTQYKRNKLFEGPRFDIESRYPVILNSLFVTMLYSGPCPILLPFCGFFFATCYAVDKYFLLRMYKRPPMLDEALAKQTASLLPYSLIIHLIMSIWVYGTDPADGGVMHSDVIDMEMLVGAGLDGDSAAIQLKYEQWMADKKENWSILGIFVTKLVRYNVLPLLLLLCLMITFMIVWAIFGKTLVPIVLKILRTLVSILTCGKMANEKTPDLGFDDSEELVPPYTGIYSEKIHIIKGKQKEISEAEKKKGWFAAEIPGADGEVIPVKQKTYVEESIVQNTKRTQGSIMMTWEAMEAAPCSYRIRANKDYQLALQELDEQLATTGHRLSITERMENSLPAPLAGGSTGDTLASSTTVPGPVTGQGAIES